MANLHVRQQPDIQTRAQVDAHGGSQWLTYLSTPETAMSEASHRIAREFFQALTQGEVPDSLLTPDVTVWTTSTGGASDKARFQAGIKLLASVFKGNFVYTVDALTAEEDRIAAEVQARGTLINGDEYRMRYVFMLRIRDGRIASIAEHNNPGPVREQLGPLIQAVMAKRQ
jgi:ketosteroid isomerase-like protein